MHVFVRTKHRERRNIGRFIQRVDTVVSMERSSEVMETRCQRKGKVCCQWGIFESPSNKEEQNKLYRQNWGSEGKGIPNVVVNALSDVNL
jgi:hypothetical protein